MIIGSGLTSAVIAGYFVDADEPVVVMEQQLLCGNVADVYHPSGINDDLYGPHLFHTGFDEIWQFVNRLATFHPDADQNQVSSGRSTGKLVYSC